MDGGEQLGVEPRQAGQVLGIGAIVLAGVLVDQAQRPVVRDNQSWCATALKSTARPRIQAPSAATRIQSITCLAEAGLSGET
jgi:hypothetical protein